MRIQIVDSETGAVIHVPALNLMLEADVKARIEENRKTVRRHRLVSRRAHAVAADVIDQVAAELREATRFA